MQVPPGEHQDASPNQLFDLTGVTRPCPHGSSAQVHNEAMAASQREELCPALAEVRNRRVDTARSFDSVQPRLPERFVRQESREAHKRLLFDGIIINPRVNISWNCFSPLLPRTMSAAAPKIKPLTCIIAETSALTAPPKLVRPLAGPSNPLALHLPAQPPGDRTRLSWVPRSPNSCGPQSRPKGSGHSASFQRQPVSL